MMQWLYHTLRGEAFNLCLLHIEVVLDYQPAGIIWNDTIYFYRILICIFHSLYMFQVTCFELTFLAAYNIIFMTTLYIFMIVAPIL